MAALDRGWIPRGNLNDDKVKHACIHEDQGDYRCVLKRGQLETAMRSALAYTLNTQNLTGTLEGQKMLNLTGKELYNVANEQISDFFEKNRLNGATCDFGKF